MRSKCVLLLALFLISCTHRDADVVPATAINPHSVVFKEILSRDRNRIYLLNQLLKEHVVADSRPEFNFDLSYEENQSAIIQTIQLLLTMDPAAISFIGEVINPGGNGVSPMSPQWPDKYWE